MAAPTTFLILFITITISFSFDPKSISNAETDTLALGQKLHDWEYLVSAGGVFKLGFFSPNLDSSSTHLGSAGPRYLGIWFNTFDYSLYLSWVANRDTPVLDSSGALTLDTDGLKIMQQGGPPILITSNAVRGNITATLLDSGNLVVRQARPDGTSGPVLWQSFDYPHNVLLPGMKLGMNLKTGHNLTLTSWVSDKSPAPGGFQFGLDPSGVDQLLVWRRGEVYFSTGVLKNGSFANAPELDYFTKELNIYHYKFVSNSEERYFTYSINNHNKSFTNILSKLDIDATGLLTLLTYTQTNDSAHFILDSAGACKMDSKNYTGICLSEKPTSCRNQTASFVRKRGYFSYENYTLSHWDYDTKLGPSDCHASCWKNCSCIGYNSASEYDTGCQYWSKGAQFIQDGEQSRFAYVLSYDGKSPSV